MLRGDHVRNFGRKYPPVQFNSPKYPPSSSSPSSLHLTTFPASPLSTPTPPSRRDPRPSPTLRSKFGIPHSLRLPPLSLSEGCGSILGADLDAPVAEWAEEKGWRGARAWMMERMMRMMTMIDDNKGGLDAAWNWVRFGCGSGNRKGGGGGGRRRCGVEEGEGEDDGDDDDNDDGDR